MNNVMWLNDEDIEEARQFVKELRSGEFLRDILPNSEEDFVGEKEHHDYIQFRRLLGTGFFVSVLETQKDIVGCDNLAGLGK